MKEYPHCAEKIDEALRLSEKCSKIIYLIMVKGTPVCGHTPNVIISLYLYYIKGMGRDAFQMADEAIA